MAELCSVWLLQVLGYEDLAVRMGDAAFPMTMPHALRSVKSDDLIDATNLRHRLPEVSAQICKCMPHRITIFIVRKSMSFSENQQVTTAQTILYGMKHDPNTANMICRIRMIQCNKWTPMHFNMHYIVEQHTKCIPCGDQ